METNSTAQQFSERHRIQKILQKTKIFGINFLILELIGICAFGFIYMSANHPYFMQRVLPDALDVFLSYISFLIAGPVIFAGPVVFAIFIILSIITLVCLLISIYQFKKWINLKLPDQNYRLAISSIIYNSISLIPALIIIPTTIVELIHYL